jgi:hypothetical protein
MRRSRLISALVLAACLAGGLALAGWWHRPDGLLHIALLDTDGDAILIQLPNGATVLVDGGTDGETLVLQLGERLPFWRRTLDLLILSDANPERLPAQLRVLQHYPADQLWYAAPLPADAALAQAWAQQLSTTRTPATIPANGSRFSAASATLTILDNGAGQRDAGLLMLIEYGPTRVVLAGGASAAQVATLPASVPAPVTLLAYPWAYALDAPQMQAWQPQAIAYTHTRSRSTPAQHSLAERATQSGTPLNRHYTRALHGTIELLSNGREACIITSQCPAYAQLQAACHASNQHCRALLQGGN